jgi:hypothetical protein
MFRGVLFVEAIGIGSNHVIQRVTITLAKKKSPRYVPLPPCYSLDQKWWRPWSQRMRDIIPRRPQDQDREHLRHSQEVSVCIEFFIASWEEQQHIFEYLEAPRSYTLNDSRIKSIGGSYKRIWPNHRWLHVLKFLDSKQSWSETAITPSYGLRLRWISTRWKGKFIKFWIELYFWYMFCYVYRGNSTWKRQQQCDENKRVEMRTTTMKRSLGNASTRPHMKKFRGLEQNQDPWSIGEWRQKLTTSNARNCLEKTTKGYTQRMTSDGADTLGSHTVDHGVKFSQPRCVSP